MKSILFEFWGTPFNGKEEQSERKAGNDTVGQEQNRLREKEDEIRDLGMRMGDEA